MSYTKQNLASDEFLSYKAVYHWINWLWAFIFCCTVILSFKGIPLIIALLTTEMSVTNKRFVYKVGWIARKTEEIHLSRIEEVNISQTLMGRILGYGSAVITGTGGSRILVRRIARPSKLQTSLLEMRA